MGLAEKAEKEQGPGTLGFSELRRQAGLACSIDGFCTSLFPFTNE